MFTLELGHLVSEQTAREMCTVDLNAGMFHRKFDGTLKKIRFDFSKRDDNEERIEKIYDMIGRGDIDNFVDGEEEFSDDNSSNEEKTEDKSEDDSEVDDKKEKKEKKDKKEKKY